MEADEEVRTTVWRLIDNEINLDDLLDSAKEQHQDFDEGLVAK